MNKLTEILEKTLAPIAGKISSITLIKSITEGMMSTIPVTVGVSIIAVLANLPIVPWQSFLANSGMLQPAKDVVAVTSSMLAIYIIVTVSYSVAKNRNQKGLIPAILATAVFLSLMPKTVTVGETTVDALLVANLGSRGIFVAIILGVVVSLLFCFLTEKGFTIKLPESVPSNVADSMGPTFVAIIIITLTFFTKYLFTLTSYGDIFTFLETYLTKPAMLLGTTGWAAILYGVLRSIFWFFGIHPSPLNAVFIPLSTAATVANIEAFQSGVPAGQLPYLEFIIIMALVTIGGTGNTLGLSLSMLRSKSEQYKALNKIAIIPGFFNINEPYVFGLPLMLNPTYFIPLIFSSVAGGLVGFAFIRLGLLGGFNPEVSIAWVVPTFIAGFFRGGIMMLLMVVITVVVQALVYYPFYKVEDNRLYQEEQLRLKELEKEAAL